MTEKETPAEQEPAAEDVVSDAEALWDEFDEQEAGATAKDAPADDGSDADDAPKADSAADGDWSEGDDGADTAPSDDEPQNDKPADIWANAPEELRNAFQEASRRADEELARRQGTDRKLRELTTELQQLRSSQQQKPPASDGDAGGEARPENMTPKEWEAFKEDYPDIAAPVEAMLKSQTAELDSFRRRFAAMDQEQVAKSYERNFEEVQAQHPDYSEIIRKPEFISWIQEQPRYLLEAAQRNGQEIVDPVEVSDIVSRYKQHAGIGAGAPSGSGKGQGQGSKPLTGTKRDRQLAATSGGTTRRGQPIRAGVPEDGDPEELWEAWDRAEAAQGR